MVATKYYKDLKYNVLNNYLLVRMKNKRYSDIGHKLISAIFCQENIDQVLLAAEGLGLAGGDPDMSVYNFVLEKYFFVEVKEDDKLSDNQKRLFPIIEKHLCPVSRFGEMG